MDALPGDLAPDPADWRCGRCGAAVTSVNGTPLGEYAGSDGWARYLAIEYTYMPCGHTRRYEIPRVDQPVRVTESLDVVETATEAGAAPYGDVRYADPGYQADKRKRYPVDTKAHAKAAWSYIGQEGNAGLYSAADLAKVKAVIKAALKKFGVTVATEAVINGQRTFDETRDLVRDALTARAKADTGAVYCYVYIADISAADVVYTMSDADDLFQCSYEIGDDESVTLGDPIEVERTYAPVTGSEDGEPPEADDPPDAGYADDMATEGWSSDQHPRAGAGSPTGGQFSTGSSGGAAGGKPYKFHQVGPVTVKSPSGGSGAGKAGAVGALKATLAYNAARKTGSGFGTPHGDPHVLKLQEALIRLKAMAPGAKADGKFAQSTADAVKVVQQHLGLPVDGQVTPALYARLVGMKALPAPKAPKAVKAVKAHASDDPDLEGRTTEAVADRVDGRVMEAQGVDDDGGRVYRVRIIEYGVSRNGNSYPAGVMREALALYEGTAAYDHHRTLEELKASTLTGLIGSYRAVEATDDGLYGSLHLLPSATHAAEALDASIKAQDEGLRPLVGISHDVRAHFREAIDRGRRVREAIEIVAVQSADVVANPSAGGKAVRAVAGGEDLEHPDDPEGTEPDGDSTKESDVPVTKADVLAALKDTTDDELAAVGLSKAGTKTTEATEPVEPPTPGEPKTSWIARTMITHKVTEAGLPSAVVESLTTELPERITEADVDGRIASLKAVLGIAERADLLPRHSGAVVTKEAVDKKAERLDAMFWEFGRPHDHSSTSKRPNASPAYRSFREAYHDFTGHRPHSYDEDVNRRILRESFGNGEYEYRGERATESMTASSWNLVLGDSVTRRLVAEYNEPALMDWMDIVSSMPPVNDFRTQRIERIGGYGVLPVVNQGQPYQPLTSPTNEEVTYAIAKRGGTEDVTLEMIANDDLRSIAKIPFHLALAAKRTIFDFVFELIRPVAAGAGPLGTLGNPNIYDSSALYVAGHNNTATNALSQTNLSAARAAMRKQAGYGDTQNILSATPRYLLVPPTLEELAFQLCTSAVAIPATPAGAANTPNIHHGLDYKVIDYWDALSSTQWAVVADPNSIPTIEIGFYLGQRDPQLFTQSDPSVGSMFNADKYTYKIRHIYSGAILDFRGFQRGNS